ncbi:MAG: aspartate carbamoyltransferase catalytic subunit [Firmicutes bacterium]|nr:aspartate carbamoyltransferase catalytic subunit [Alicyclobacillaceae bacterium]MCL6496491.1 aspartate carbamoyltransferase catalytic subunit [Bacillota bacterium]
MDDFLGIAELSTKTLEDLLDTAQALSEILSRPIKKVPTLRGRAIANAFFEPSTRTRNAFELAAKYLSADVVNFSSTGSSLEKGESVWDTVKTLEALGVDAVVVRHREAGVPQLMAERLAIPVINAGDGEHEHPTQALLDLLTVRQRFGRLQGLRVAIVGDVLHSRVARSDLYGFLALGARVTLVGPPGLVSEEWREWGAEVTWDLAQGIRGAHVVQVLRIQRERQAQGLLPSWQEYRERWGITREHLGWADPNVLVLHPGPQNRGVEIDSEVLEGAQSAVLDQVRNGVAVRMAVLYRLLGGAAE